MKNMYLFQIIHRISFSHFSNTDLLKNLRFFYWNSSSDESKSVFSLFVTLACRGWTAARIPVEAAAAAFVATEAAVVATTRAL